MYATGQAGETVYEYSVTYVFVNKGNSTVVLPLNGSLLRFYLVPDIEGWQELANYSVVIDGNDTTKSFRLTVDSERNQMLVSDDVLELEPGSNHTIQVVQLVRVRSFGSREFKDMPAEMEACNVTGELVYTGGFWSDAENSTALDDLANELWNKSDEDWRQYVLEVVKRVAGNVEYGEPVEGGVSLPRDVLKNRKGACGDRAGLITALLRRKGIGSYLYLSLYYYGKEPLKTKQDNIEVVYDKARLHIFSMCRCGDKEFPVDTTLPLVDPDRPALAIKGALVNKEDKVIVIARFVGGSPNSNVNTLLEIYSPSSDVNLKVTIKLKVVERAYALTIYTLLSIAVLIAAVILYVALGKTR